MVKDYYTVDELHARIKKAGGDLKTVCKKLGISFVTFYNWKNGKGEPGVSQYHALLKEIINLEGIQNEDTNKTKGA